MQARGGEALRGLRGGATWALAAALLAGTLWTVCRVPDTVFRPETMLIMCCSSAFYLLLERVLPPLELIRDSETKQVLDYIDDSGAIRPSLPPGQLRGAKLLRGCGAMSVPAFSFTSFVHDAIMAPVSVAYMACFSGRRAGVMLEGLPCPGAAAGGVDLAETFVAASFFLSAWESGHAVQELGEFLRASLLKRDHVVHSTISLFAPLIVIALSGTLAGPATIALYSMNHVSTLVLDFRSLNFSWSPRNFEMVVNVAFALTFLGVRIGYIPWHTATYMMWADQQWEAARSCAEWSMPGGHPVREVPGGHSWFGGHDYVLRVIAFLDISLFALNLYWGALILKKAYTTVFPGTKKRA